MKWRRIIVAVVLGIMTSVMVAWACAWRQPDDVLGYDTVTDESGGSWMIIVNGGGGFRFYTTYFNDGSPHFQQFVQSV